MACCFPRSPTRLLFQAAAEGKQDVIKEALAAGANVDAVDAVRGNVRGVPPLDCGPLPQPRGTFAPRAAHAARDAEAVPRASQQQRAVRRTHTRAAPPRPNPLALTFAAPPHAASRRRRRWLTCACKGSLCGRRATRTSVLFLPSVFASTAPPQATCQLLYQLGASLEARDKARNGRTQSARMLACSTSSLTAAVGTRKVR